LVVINTCIWRKIVQADTDTAVCMPARCLSDHRPVYAGRLSPPPVMLMVVLRRWSRRQCWLPSW
jgi:hypothetical protein